MGQDGTFEWEIDKSSHDLGFEVTRHKSNLVTIHMDARKGIEIQKGDEDFEKSVKVMVKFTDSDGSPTCDAFTTLRFAKTGRFAANQ